MCLCVVCVCVCLCVFLCVSACICARIYVWPKKAMGDFTCRENLLNYFNLLHRECVHILYTKFFFQLEYQKKKLENTSVRGL